MVAKPTPTAPPADVPNRDQPATFSTRADAWVAWEGGDFYPYLTTAVDFVEQEANAAEAARDAAAVSAAAADATAWVSGASYTAGDVVWSLVNFYPYRAKTTHSGVATDPSADGTRWANIALANVTVGAMDTTPGRLLKVGDAGLLSTDAARAIGDFSGVSLGATSFYRTSGNVATVTNSPPGSFTRNSTGIVINGESENQSVLHLLSDPSDGMQAWVGAKNAAASSVTWAQLYTSTNLLGTVSQSGGDPTGAAMGSGSNGNGRWERFANGLQICTRTMTTSSSFDMIWTYPAAFAEPPVVSLTARAVGIAIRATMSGDPTATQCPGIYTAGSGNTRLSGDSSLIAIGRWF